MNSQPIIGSKSLFFINQSYNPLLKSFLLNNRESTVNPISLSHINLQGAENII